MIMARRHHQPEGFVLDCQDGPHGRRIDVGGGRLAVAVVGATTSGYARRCMVSDRHRRSRE